jgi:hypothetical protein
MVGIELEWLRAGRRMGHQVTGRSSPPRRDRAAARRRDRAHAPLAISEQDLERLVVIVWEAIVEATSERELAAA